VGACSPVAIGPIEMSRHVVPHRVIERNLYGWSKHMFDLAVAERAARKEKMPPQWAGLKFFNVFGANEYHKGEMMSLVAKRFDDAKAGRKSRSGCRRRSPLTKRR
jgi:nucleoside-diphosphate-sugar epimerase